jgi:RNA polymerase sigma-70 factor (ECF subfamily)
MVATHHDRIVHNGQPPAPPGTGDAVASWELVAAAQSSDREAFGRLYSRYVGPVGRFLTARVPDRALAADLTSETFLRALRRIDSVHDQGRDVGAWFTTIARNLVLDHVKSSRSRLETTTGEFPDHGRLAPTAQTPTPEHLVIEQDTAARLWRHVERLPADQQECIRLRFAQGLSTAQTAAAMNRSDEAVKALRHRAISGLRASLTAEDQPVSPARHARTTTADPLARARHAVTAAQGRAAEAGEQHHAAEEAARTRRVAHWDAQDRAAEEHERDGSGLTVAEGVA